MKTSDSIFLRALNKESLKTPPIWYMRQAGRYLPEFKKIRHSVKLSYSTLKKFPKF